MNSSSWPARHLCRLSALILTFAGLTLLVAACGSSNDPGGSGGKASVRLKWLHQSQHAGSTPRLHRATIRTRVWT